MEVLGRRLDTARHSLANAKSEWSKNYWKQNVSRLLFQWKQLPILHDGDAQTTIIPKWAINYDFYEKGHMNEGFGITDRAFYKVFRQNADLENSWTMNREKRLARAQ